jgi:predicted nucleic acid-binding protein
MKLEELPDGGQIFVDANVLIYHFSGISSECRAFLARCESALLHESPELILQRHAKEDLLPYPQLARI